MPLLSPDVRLALSPGTTYSHLEQQAVAASFGGIASRLALVALAIGTGVTMSSSGRVSAGLVLSVTLCWSAAVVVQILAALTLVATARDRRVSSARAFELLFAGHVPWSLWVMLAGGYLGVLSTAASSDDVALSALIPFAWTLCIIWKFCRNVLRSSPGRARLETLLHQSIVWGFGFAFLVLIAGGWDRLLSEVGL